MKKKKGFKGPALTIEPEEEMAASVYTEIG